MSYGLPYLFRSLCFAEISWMAMVAFNGKFSLITAMISPHAWYEKGLKWLQADAKASLLRPCRSEAACNAKNNKEQTGKFNSSVRQYSPLTRDSNRIIPSVFRQEYSAYAGFIVRVTALLKYGELCDMRILTVKWCFYAIRAVPFKFHMIFPLL